MGVHREGGLLPGLDLADVGLVHRHLELHLRQVVGDGEEGRRRQRGGHRLAHVDVARDDDALDRRLDGGVAQVGLHALQGGPGRRASGAVLVEGRARGVDLDLRHHAAGLQRVDARAVALGLPHPHVGLDQLGLRLLHLGAQERGVELRQHLPAAHAVVEVRVQGGDGAADLAAHQDGRHRLDGAGRRHLHADVPALHGLGPVARLVPARALGAPEPEAARRQGQHHHHDPSAPVAHRRSPPREVVAAARESVAARAARGQQRAGPRLGGPAVGRAPRAQDRLRPGRGPGRKARWASVTPRRHYNCRLPGVKAVRRFPPTPGRRDSGGRAGPTARGPHFRAARPGSVLRWDGGRKP